MATVVDELVVKLGLDSAAFNKGVVDLRVNLKLTVDEARRVAQTMEREGQKAASFFAQVKTEALGLIGVLLGGKGIEAFAKDAMNSLAGIGREAALIGMEIPQLVAFSNAIERNGGSADAARKSFVGYQAAVERFKVYGDNNLPGLLSTVGANISESPFAVFMKAMQFLEAHSGTLEGLQRSVLVFQGLGFDPGMINAMIQIAKNGGMAKEMQLSKELGLPTDEQVKRMTQLQHDTTALGQAAEQTGVKWLTNLEPALDSFVLWMTKEIELQPGVIAGLALIAGYFTVIAGLNFGAVMAFLGRMFPLLGLLGLTGPGLPGEEQVPTTGEELLKTEHERWGPMWTTIKRMFGVMPPIADQAMPAEAATFLQKLSDPESNGNYYLKNGGASFSDTSKFPEGVAPGGTSTASGRYQFTSDTWKEAAAALGLKDFSPASQDQAAWWLASREYRNKTGRDLLWDLREGGHGAQIAGALHGRWPTITGGTGAGNASTPSSPGGAYPSGYNTTGQPGGLPVPPLPPPAAPRASSSVSNSNAMTIGTVNVHTMATDATGIARDIQSELADITMAQANRGPN